MQIGPWTLTAVETGRLRLDGGAMFGTVPKVLWEKAHPADEKNRIELSMRALLLEGMNRRVLVDTGMGEKWDAKAREIYALRSPPGGVLGALAAAGIEPATISDVILTHLHFDHAGGATMATPEGIVPAFPHARYHLQSRNLEWARRANDRERASYLRENFEPLVEADVLELHDGNRELFPGIELVVSDGHTEGLQMVCVRADEKGEGDATELWYAADLIPTSSHVPAAWVMAYDIAALRSVEEKKALLAGIAARDGWLFYEHDPHFAASRVVVENGRYRAVEGVASL